MTEQNDDITRALDQGASLRGRAIALGVLIALTVAGGVAARHLQAPGGAPSALVGPLQFNAGSGGPVHFSGQLDRSSVLAGGDGIVKLELVIRGDELPLREQPRVPTDLVVVLDRSGSMQGPALEHAKASIRELIAQLSPEDRFALVSYASGAGVDVPLAAATPAAREQWRAVLQRIRADGGTNMAAGLDLGHGALGAREKGRAARIILLSDGHANQGDHSLAGLTRRAGRAVAGEYVLSAVGVGSGFDETVMSRMADSGTGNFYYVESTEDLARIFADEFATARETVAQGLEVQIDPASGVVVIDAAGYPLDHAGGRVTFRPGSLFAGQERRIWLTLRTPVAESEGFDLGEFRLAYRQEGDRRELAFDETPRIACVAGEEEFYSNIDGDRWARSVMVDDYNVLRRSLAGAVAAGDRGRAMREIVEFEEMKLEQNRHMKRGDVALQLRSLSVLRAETDEALAAPEPARKSAAKQMLQEGRDAQRVGAKK